MYVTDDEEKAQGKLYEIQTHDVGQKWPPVGENTILADPVCTMVTDITNIINQKHFRQTKELKSLMNSKKNCTFPKTGMLKQKVSYVPNNIYY